jgi:hypothetical protein
MAPRVVATREFRVSWNAKKKRFVACDHNGAVLGTSHARDGAIASAVRYANLVAGQGYRVIVMVESDGKFKKDYVAEPPRR